MQFSLRGLLIFFVIIGCLCGGFLCVMNVLVSPFKGQDPGFVTEEKDLPVLWNGLVEAANRANIRIHGAEFFLHNKFIDEEYAIRMDASLELLEFLIRERDLAPLAVNQVPSARRNVSEFWKKMPPKWTTEAQAIAPTYYATIDEQGTSSEHIVMMYDEKSQKIYLWHRFDF